mgnify:CR=1 FL=1
MGEILSQRDRLTQVSISRLAEGLGMDRKTVAKRIAEWNVAPSSMRDGYPVYPFRDAVEACLGNRPQVGDEGGETDPRLLSPEKRKAWFQSEESRLTVETKTRRLIPASEVESEFAELVKLQVQFLDTLPDSLERDCSLTPEQVDAMHQSIDRQRQSLFDRLVSDELVTEATG